MENVNYFNEFFKSVASNVFKTLVPPINNEETPVVQINQRYSYLQLMILKYMKQLRSLKIKVVDLI